MNMHAVRTISNGYGDRDFFYGFECLANQRTDGDALKWMDASDIK